MPDVHYIVLVLAGCKIIILLENVKEFHDEMPYFRDERRKGEDELL